MTKKGLQYYQVKIWEMIGFIVNLSQMIEYNIANIVALNELLGDLNNNANNSPIDDNAVVKKSQSLYETLSTKELGRLLGESTKKRIFESDLIAKIDEVRASRNHYIHHFFKEDLFTKNFQERPRYLMPEIQKTIANMKNLNDELVGVFDHLKQEVKRIV